MLKRLRRKFVLINMIMVSVVVIVVLASICIINYQQSLNAVYSSLHTSIEQAISTQEKQSNPFSDNHSSNLFFNTPLSDLFSSFDNSSSSSSGPDAHAQKDSSGSSTSGSDSDSSSSSGSSSSSSSDSSALNADVSTQPQIGNSGESRVIPVAVYQVTSLTDYDMNFRASSAALVSDSADACIEQAFYSNSGTGFIDAYGLIYERTEHNGLVYLAFASTSSMGNWQGFTATMILVGILTLLVFFLLSLIFSRWALKPVEESWTKQKQFLADASHELKTPLTVILANTDIMLKHPERSIASQEQWLESTQHEALGMQELVVSMLDLAKLDAEENTGGSSAASVPMEDVNLSDTALGTLLQFESIAFEKQVDIEDDICEDLHVTGNIHQLERLCGTLLDNACKYAPANSTIEVALKQAEAAAYHNLPNTAYQGVLPKGKVIALSVKNEGEAVDPEDLPHLFDRFYRSDKARTHESSGNSYGLGLAIAAGTVTAHGGCIMATSSTENGTTFTALFPKK